MNPGSSISNFLLPVIPSMTSGDWEGCWCRKRGRAGLRAQGRLRRGRRFRVSPSPPPPAGRSSASPGRAELPTGRFTSRCPAVVTKPRAPQPWPQLCQGSPLSGLPAADAFCTRALEARSFCRGPGRPHTQSCPGRGCSSEHLLSTLSLCVCLCCLGGPHIALCYKSPLTVQGPEAPRAGAAYPAGVPQPGRGSLASNPNGCELVPLHQGCGQEGWPLA